MMSARDKPPALGFQSPAIRLESLEIETKNRENGGNAGTLYNIFLALIYRRRRRPWRLKFLSFFAKI
jgi:hypothetical protein